MEFPKEHESTTLDRDGLTTIETKRWLLGSLYEDQDREQETVPGVSDERVASD